MGWPKSSNKDRRRAPTRNTTKNTTISAGTMNGDSVSDPYDKDYVTQLPKKTKAKTDPPIKMKILCDKGKKEMTKEQNKNK